MSIASLLPIAINLSIALIVFGLGLGASLNDAAYLIRRPGLLLRSLLSMNIVMPVFALLLVVLFQLHPAIELAIVALSLSPVPPFLPSTQTKGGGTAPYVVSLLVTTAILSIITVPLGIWSIEAIEHIDADIPRIAMMLALTVTLPLIVGMILHDLFPSLASRIMRPASLLGMGLLVVSILPVLVMEWGLVWSMVGNGTLVILVLFALVGLAVGHVLGGPNPHDQVVLALATASRHPGVAIAVAAVNTEHVAPVAAVVIWHLLVGVVLSAPYLKWMHLMPEAPHKPPVKPHSPPIR
ncbi:hypothetical protein VW23_024725 [Devosia insulae DS-56]|uniref:Na+-dependent transporter n=1 Tax=Devosia insulae DS-56 TaxID=1116389 RepID=A0A1E5XM02_9HYPH|nr:hypothetical protein [Devosia insulae]OEO29631.1 hypothetical protein VW23_024725 [Devosia insulae DS-56]